MAKRNFPEKYSGSGYSDWGIRRTIRESLNVARWSPWHAHAWMEEARDRLSLDEPYFDEFNKAVQAMNLYWLSLRHYRWYDESDFWSFDGEPRPLTFLEQI